MCTVKVYQYSVKDVCILKVYQCSVKIGDINAQCMRGCFISLNILEFFLHTLVSSCS